MALLASLGFLFHVVMNKSSLAASPPWASTAPMTIKGGGSSPSEAFVDLSSLSSVPLEQLQNMHALVMQWPADQATTTQQEQHTTTQQEQHTTTTTGPSSSGGGGREYFFHVLSAVRDADITTLQLSADSTLITDKARAVLLGRYGEELGRVQFQPAAAPQRQLGKLMQRLADEGVGRYPRNHEVGNPESAFEAYCRYGCGKVAVTFPYYYRPFFGYGFPLVGTEAMFPQGYGGYPGADLLAHQGAGVVPAQMGQQQMQQQRPPQQQMGMRRAGG
eukprot:GHVS01086259.1.p1 GENE.GHVS01086259.1~~GHVS01086259.1.p1  ORF type:complete len:306 (-),score=97.06 GHVS01086259.1:613-1437(-)